MTETPERPESDTPLTELNLQQVIGEIRLRELAADAKEREPDDLLTAFECACLASDSFEGRRTLRAEIRARLRASSLGEPVSQEAPGLPPGEFQRALEYVEVATRSEGTRDAEATELLALAASAQRIVDDADRTHHSLGRFDLDNPSGRAGGNTSLHALSKILPLARRVAERALRDTSRSAFSGIPRTENEPSAQQMREALSGIECSLAEFCDESAPNRETMVADAARDAAAAIADLRRNRCRSGEMCSVDGCSSTAVAWRDERGVPYCDQCKRGVSRMRSRSRKTFNPIVLARLSASAPSPEDKGSANG